MDYKWIGAVLIISGSGGVGFSLAADYLRQTRELQALLRVLDYMTCELTYRMTPLPDLCRGAARDIRGSLSAVLSGLAQQLDGHRAPDVAAAMSRCLTSHPELSAQIRDLLTLFGAGLGRFDLEGQLKGIEAVRSAARAALEAQTDNRDIRIRNYQTLGLCAGAALAILLL